MMPAQKNVENKNPPRSYRDRDRDNQDRDQINTRRRWSHIKEETVWKITVGRFPV